MLNEEAYSRDGGIASLNHLKQQLDRQIISQVTKITQELGNNRQMLESSKTAMRRQNYPWEDIFQLEGTNATLCQRQERMTADIRRLVELAGSFVTDETGQG